MSALAIAIAVFLMLMTLIVGVWWAFEARRRLRTRLETELRNSAGVDPEILRAQPGRPTGRLVKALWPRLSTLQEQAGYMGASTDLPLHIAGFAAIAAILGWLKTGSVAWGVLAAVIGASLPVVYLVYRRYQRLKLFAQQFPEALDMMARAIRAGNAMSVALQLVGEEMPEPTGREFAQVAEEVRLGMDVGEALAGLARRAPTEDVLFFCTAIRIQRGSGGNLAELLDRLSELIRERFKILSHARALSAQHRWSAIVVGVFPAIFAVMLQFLHPGYFDPLLTHPLGLYMIAAGVILEAIGFFWIWRIAQIKV
jgi:tight adherence protein B